MIILSPSKKLELTPIAGAKVTQPALLSDAESLIDVLKELSKEEVSGLMKLSHNLTELNYQRYQEFTTPFTSKNAAPAITSFKGDVYDGLEAHTLTDEDIAFAEGHLRILSGLYGVLHPLDLIQPYRLEMGTRLPTERGKNLYEFWGDKVMQSIERDLKPGAHIINLASNEYNKAVLRKSLKAPVLTIDFKERRNGEYRSLMLYVKRARGMMARYIIQNRIIDIEAIKAFNMDGYSYNDTLSEQDRWVFVR